MYSAMKVVLWHHRLHAAVLYFDDQNIGRPDVVQRVHLFRDVLLRNEGGHGFRSVQQRLDRWGALAGSDCHRRIQKMGLDVVGDHDELRGRDVSIYPTLDQLNFFFVGGVGVRDQTGLCG